MTFFLLLVAIGALAWVLSRNQSLSRMQAKLQQDVTFLKKELDDYEQRYKPIIDIDKGIREREIKLSELGSKQQTLESEISSANTALKRINEELALANDAAYLAEIGYYEPHYEFEDVPSYEVEL